MHTLYEYSVLGDLKNIRAIVEGKGDIVTREVAIMKIIHPTEQRQIISDLSKGKYNHVVVNVTGAPCAIYATGGKFLVREGPVTVATLKDARTAINRLVGVIDARIETSKFQKATHAGALKSISSGTTRVSIGPTTREAEILDQIRDGILANHEVIVTRRFKVLPVDKGDRAGWSMVVDGREKQFFWTRKRGQGIADESPRQEAELAKVFFRTWKNLD